MKEKRNASFLQIRNGKLSAEQCAPMAEIESPPATGVQLYSRPLDGGMTPVPFKALVKHAPKPYG